MHPDPHPPYTTRRSLAERTRPRRAWANLTRGSRPLILLATVGTLGGLAMLFAAWVLIIAGGTLGFLAGVLLALLGIASLALAAATLADALEWRE